MKINKQDQQKLYIPQHYTNTRIILLNSLNQSKNKKIQTLVPKRKIKLHQPQPKHSDSNINIFYNQNIQQKQTIIEVLTVQQKQNNTVLPISNSLQTKKNTYVNRNKFNTKTDLSLKQIKQRKANSARTNDKQSSSKKQILVKTQRDQEKASQLYNTQKLSLNISKILKDYSNSKSKSREKDIYHLKNENYYDKIPFNKNNKKRMIQFATDKNFEDFTSKISRIIKTKYDCPTSLQKLKTQNPKLLKLNLKPKRISKAQTKC